jgi:hypothetical protein
MLKEMLRNTEGDVKEHRRRHKRNTEGDVKKGTLKVI